MGILDIVIIVLLVWGAYKGWTSGFLKQLVSLSGFLVGLFIASQFYSTLGKYITPQFGTSPSISDLLAFIILWVMVPIFLGLIASGLTKMLKEMRAGWLNSLLGLTLGVGKYLILLSCIFNAMAAINIIDPKKQEASHLFQPVKGALTVLFDDVAYERIIKTETSDTIYIERTDSTYGNK
jgi:membrane protein required for colicin V production